MFQQTATSAMMEFRSFHQHQEKGKFTDIITVGIDLAKNVFAVYGADDSGKAMLAKPKIESAHPPEGTNKSLREFYVGKR